MPPDAPSPFGEDAADEAGARVLVLAVDTRRIAVAAECVRAVMPLPPVAPMPGAPPWITGLAALRGAIVPVVDVRRRAVAAPHAAEVPHAGASASGDRWVVLLDDGRRSAALAGTRVTHVAAAEPCDVTHVALDAPRGLPTRGAVRLSGDVPATTARADDARPRRLRAVRASGRDEPADARPMALLDVAALLDDIFDGD